MTESFNNHIPGNNELAAIVHGESTTPVDIAAEQLEQLRRGKQTEATAVHISEILSVRPDLSFGANVKTVGVADARVANIGPDGKIESYDF